ncbi:hypothetical protein BB558_001087 [Smittium angustum]|nr:hypothetical protein BB558_001087 [Smittium angustum]
MFCENERRVLLKGSELANSFTFNPHKMLGVPLQCSFLLVRDGLDEIRNRVALKANYLFHRSEDMDEDDPSSWDIGDSTVGCGRKPDSLKMWLSWRYYGTEGFSNRVSNALLCANRFSELIKERNDKYELFRYPVSNLVSFWYIPKCLRSTCKPDIFTESQKCYPEELAEVTKKICDLVNSKGEILLDYASVTLHEGETPVRVPEFFRIPFNSPIVDENYLEKIINEIEVCGKEIYGEQ